MMIRRFVDWFFAPSQKLIVEEIDTYSKLIELQDRITALEAENVETSNCLYELMNSIDAVDARIDILTAEQWIKETKDNV
jgi:hypothetical protein